MDVEGAAEAALRSCEGAADAALRSFRRAADAALGSVAAEAAQSIFPRLVTVMSGAVVIALVKSDAVVITHLRITVQCRSLSPPSRHDHLSTLIVPDPHKF